MAWSFQVIIPLFIIFIGFASVSSLKSNGILKLIMVQGCSYRELLFGKVLGIYAVTMVYFIPLLVLGLSLICYFTGAQMPFSWPDLILRSLLLIISYSLYLLVFVGIVVLVSAFSKSSKDSLLILLIYWFVMIFVYPRTAQSLGEYCYQHQIKMNLMLEFMLKLGYKVIVIILRINIISIYRILC